MSEGGMAWKFQSFDFNGANGNLELNRRRITCPCAPVGIQLSNGKSREFVGRSDHAAVGDTKTIIVSVSRTYSGRSRLHSGHTVALSKELLAMDQ